MRKLTRSLRGRLLLGFTVVAAGSLIVATALTVVTTRRALASQMGSDRAQLAEQLARFLTATDADLMGDIGNLTSSGDVMAAALGMGAPESVETLFSTMRETNALFRRLTLYTGDGALMATAGEGDAPAASVQGTPWFQGALGQDERWLGPVERSGGAVTRLIAVPVRASNGQSLGMVVATLDWERLASEAFADLEAKFAAQGQALSAYLVNRGGTIVGATDAGAVLQEAKVQDEAFREALKGGVAGADTGPFLDIGKALVSFAPVEALRGTGDDTPFVFLAEPTSTALASARHLLLLLVVTTLGVTGVVGIVAWFLSGRISRPVIEATHVAELLAVGDTEQSLEAGQGDDEGARLKSALHGLLEYMRSLTAAAQKVSRGETELELSPKSEKDELSRAFLTVGGVTRDLLEELGGLARSAADGDLSARARAERFSGGYQQVAEGLNATLDAVVAPVNEAAEVLDRLAARDLTARVKGKYRGDHARIKGALNGALDALGATLAQVSGAAGEVARAAGQIEGGSQSLAQTTNEQASSLEEVSSSLQEMASMARQNAANAKEARSLSDAARGSAETGLGRMEHLSEAMDRIKGSADETAKIVKTIDEIAFQTNLLALNAAVEAARAGEAGKSFAVVAEEVRNLAMRSADAAKNTSALIEEAVNNASNGFELNQEVLASLSEIQERVERTSEVVAEITAASDQQNQGVEEISQAVEELNRGTQSAAATAEESAGSAEELTSQSTRLQELVSAFRLAQSAATVQRQGGDGARRGAGADTPASVRLRSVQAEELVGSTAGAAPNGHGNGVGGNGTTASQAAIDPESVIPFEDDDLSHLEEF